MGLDIIQRGNPDVPLDELSAKLNALMSEWEADGSLTKRSKEYLEKGIMDDKMRKAMEEMVQGIDMPDEARQKLMRGFSTEEAMELLPYMPEKWAERQLGHMFPSNDGSKVETEEEEEAIPLHEVDFAKLFPSGITFGKNGPLAAPKNGGAPQAIDGARSEGGSVRIKMPEELLAPNAERDMKLDRKVEVYIDYDPLSRMYRQDLHDRTGKRTMMMYNHIDMDAPFAVRLDDKRSLHNALWRFWVDDGAALTTDVSGRVKDFDRRAEKHRDAFLALYSKHGPRSKSHTKFTDDIKSFIYLSARATGHRHLRILQLIEAALKVDTPGLDPGLLSVVRESRDKDGVELFLSSIDKGITWKERGNQAFRQPRQALSAVVFYARGLASMSPWAPLEAFMFPQEDTEGLSTTVNALKLNIAQCAIQLADELPIIIPAGIECALSVLRCPFRTNGQVTKGAWRLARLMELQALHVKSTETETDPGPSRTSEITLEERLGLLHDLQAEASVRPAGKRFLGADPSWDTDGLMGWMSRGAEAVRYLDKAMKGL